MAKAKAAATPRLTASRIRAALSAADEARRRRDADLARARLAERARSRKRAEALLTPYWSKTRLDVAAFEASARQAQAAMRRRAAQQTAEAIRQSVSARDRLRHALQSWRKTVEALRLPEGPLVGHALPGFAVIDKPFIVWPTHGLEMDDSHVEPGNSWAKIRGRSEKASGSENLRFIFVWQNPSDRFAAVNVASFLGLNGSCQAGAGGGTAGIFPGGTSSLQLAAFLNVWEWWNQPPTNPLPKATQWRQVLSLSADGGGWFESVGAIEVRSVTGNFDVGYDLFVLEPNGVAVFEVTLLVSCQTDDGHVQLDFSSGGFQVTCPMVALAILT